MKSSKPKRKPRTPADSRSSEFAQKATAAMRRAQKEAERENARFGMKLVLTAA